MRDCPSIHGRLVGGAQGVMHARLMRLVGKRPDLPRSAPFCWRGEWQVDPADTLD
jgi:hypothetical protein